LRIIAQKRYAKQVRSATHAVPVQAERVVTSERLLL
jgi:hypothetical protein